MKQKRTLKSLLVIASIFSLFAFLFVNIDANFCSKGKCSVKSELVQTQLEDDAEEGKVTVPDFTMLGRLWDVAHKLIDRKN